MVLRKSESLHHSTLNLESSRNNRDFGHRKHIPRSVCDTERDRRQHKDPLKEEELQ